jgi:hypothetical protein
MVSQGGLRRAREVPISDSAPRFPTEQGRALLALDDRLTPNVALSKIVVGNLECNVYCSSGCGDMVYGKRAQRFVSLAELARQLQVPRYRLSEWVRQGLLPTPMILGVRTHGRVTAYGYAEGQVPKLRRLVEKLKGRGVHSR